MATFLFDKIVFGPVKSRRLGVSLGINLLPVTSKLCNFDCIYCECGLTRDYEGSPDIIPGRRDVYEALELTLSEMKLTGQAPDVITFAGNGEPTLHPEFSGIIDDSIKLRNLTFPKAKIAVLSNSTTINNPSVKEALLRVDMNILKLDSAFISTINLHNQPFGNINIEELINNLAGFNGKLIIQTLFLRGTKNGIVIDNTTPTEINAWLQAIERIRPSEVMIYTISRDTPEGSHLNKVPLQELNKIASKVRKLGIKTKVSG
jgi:wyosine [tRNA(Phe)-imidazoG37] synthetase (radical SAM superfamily)